MKLPSIVPTPLERADSVTPTQVYRRHDEPTRALPLLPRRRDPLRVLRRHPELGVSLGFLLGAVAAVLVLHQAPDVAGRSTPAASHRAPAIAHPPSPFAAPRADPR